MRMKMYLYSVPFKLMIFLLYSVFTVYSNSSFIKIEPNDKYPSLLTYSLHDIKKPTKILKTKQDVLDALNFHIVKMDRKFELYIDNYTASKLPTNLNELEHYFIEKIDVYPQKKSSGNISKVLFELHFNVAGRVIYSNLNKTPIKKSDKKALELESKVESLLKKIDGKSDYEKVVYIHDYIVRNTNLEYENSDSREPYDVLIKHVGNDEGYAETLQMLFTISGIENRVVISSSRGSGIYAHYFNKIKLDGQWYNIDASVDDSGNMRDKNVVRTYLLVSDAVLKQRYTWQEARYPLSTVENNWHIREGFVVSKQSELNDFVRKQINKKANFFSVWVSDYNSRKYSIKEIADRYKDISISSSVIPAIGNQTNETKQFATAIVFRVDYPNWP